MGRAAGSLWLEPEPDTSFPALAGDASADVVVIGAGIAGVMSALACREAGLEVVVLERDLVGGGTTGRSTVKASFVHGTRASEIADRKGAEAATMYLLSQHEGLDSLRRSVESMGVRCDWSDRPHVLVASTRESLSLLERERDLQLEAGLEVVLEHDIDELPFPIAGALVAPEQAQFHPVKLVRGLAEAAEGDGCRFHEGSAVTEIERGDQHLVTTEKGAVRADHVVVATHEPIVPDGLLFAKQVPERDYCVAGSLTGPVPSGMYLTIDEPIRSMRSVAVDGDELLIVAGEHHRVGEGGETDRHHETLAAWAVEAFGGFERRAVWSAQDPTPIDLLPHVGPVAERLYVVTGFGRWGFTNAVVAAEIVATAVTGGSHPWADLYAADRSHGWRAMGSALAHNAQVAKRFVGDRLSSAWRDAEIPPAGPSVVTTDEGPVAVHVDDEGGVTAVSAVCTHLGCLVRWESAADSWACPCHGSRFAPDGEVLEGPATEPLDEVSLDVDHIEVAGDGTKPKP